ISVIIITILTIKGSLNLSFFEIAKTAIHHPSFKVFDWDIHSGSNFFKQFISGLLITVALVGLDQSMMQKTLTVSHVGDAKKNVYLFSFFIAMAQTLFLGLGVLIYIFAERKGIKLDMQNGQFVNTDGLFPLLALNYLGQVGVIAFLIGVIASTFASIDSCIAALTTSISYDFIDIENKPDADKKRLKNLVLLGVNISMFLIVLMFWNSHGAIINTIFIIAGYTYGPLLGLYITGFFTNLQLKEQWVPLACISAAGITFLLNIFFTRFIQFDFGFMNIFVNALLTILFFILIRKPKNDPGR
ncbi:MAG: sodium:solute symporter, partial [Saprospiraceae bacterium]